MVDKNLKIFKLQEKKYKNTLVLDDFNVVLFARVIFDDPEDYYYEYIRFQPHQGTETYLSSCCGSLRPLVDYLDPEVYNELVRTWNFNSTLQIKEI
jgi:hypothetical protein